MQQKSRVVIASANGRAITFAPEQEALDVLFVSDFIALFDEYLSARRGEGFDAYVFDLDLRPSLIGALMVADSIKNHDRTAIVVFVARSLTLRQRLDLAPIADAVLEGDEWTLQVFDTVEALILGKAEIKAHREQELALQQSRDSLKAEKV